jgi:uncharacterized membrane protein YjfL (UPF0719 family)
LSQRKKEFFNLKAIMEITLVLLIVFYFVFYLLRPTSKEELKRFNKKDNWSNMGF